MSTSVEFHFVDVQSFAVSRFVHCTKVQLQTKPSCENPSVGKHLVNYNHFI